MLYYPKPQPVEAVLLDSAITGVRFMQSGEFSMVNVNNGFHLYLDGELQEIPYGEYYLVRDAWSLRVVHKEEFEENWIPDQAQEVEA